MNLADVLPAVLDRLAAAAGEVALFSERELAEWQQEQAKEAQRSYSRERDSGPSLGM